MKTTPCHGYDRLIPETKLERSLLELVIKTAMDGQEIKVWDHPHVGEIKVQEAWDAEGWLKVIAIVPMPEDSDPSPFDWQKSYTFRACVLDASGEPRVLWQGKTAPWAAQKVGRDQASFAPVWPTISPADLV